MKNAICKLLILAVAFAFGGGAELAEAQNQQPAQQNQQAQQPSVPAEAAQDVNAPPVPAEPAQDEAATQEPATAQQPGQEPATAQQPAQGQTTAPSRVDPAAGPLRPVPAEPLPDAPSTTQQQQQPRQRPRIQQPVGVGAAPSAETTGGAASKPAGSAIAPAKQSQRRALVIKLGLLGGAAVALGTVFALSKGTKSIPPGAVR